MGAGLLGATFQPHLKTETAGNQRGRVIGAWKNAHLRGQGGCEDARNEAWEAERVHWMGAGLLGATFQPHLKTETAGNQRGRVIGAWKNAHLRGQGGCEDARNEAWEAERVHWMGAGLLGATFQPHLKTETAGNQRGRAIGAWKNALLRGQEGSEDARNEAWVASRAHWMSGARGR